MRLHVRHWLLMASVSAPILACAASAGEGRDEHSPASPQVRLSFLPKGTPCSVRLRAETKAAGNGQTDTIRTSYTGRVAGASETSLSLTVTDSMRTIRRTTAGSRIPYLGRLFTNNGIRHETPGAGEEKVVSIPVETIESITLPLHQEPGTGRPAP